MENLTGLFSGREVRKVLFLAQKGERGIDASTDFILDNPEDYLVQSAFRIFNDLQYRSYIEAALLATNDLSEIATTFGIELELVEFYARCFYNVTGLSPLQKARLVELCEDKTEKMMKMWGLSQGLKFLAWRLGLKVEISPVEGMYSIYADSFFKAKEAFFNPNAAEASKESLKWSRQAFEAAKVIKSWVSDVDAARKELELALDEVNSTNVDFGDISDVYKQNGEVYVEEEVMSIDEVMKQNASQE